MNIINFSNPSTIIHKFRVQGAKLTHVKAEWFFSPSDFLLWSHLSNYENGNPVETEADLLVRHEKYSSQVLISLIFLLYL